VVKIINFTRQTRIQVLLSHQC